MGYGSTESFEINYRNNADVVAEFERITHERPDDFRFKPILGEDVKDWYNRKIAFFRKIPGAVEMLASKVEEIRNADWEVKEVRFDFSNVNVVVLLATEKKIRLVALRNDA